MICKNCGKIVNRVRILKGREVCAKCGGFSEAGGIRTDGVLSRQRVRMDSIKHEGDVLNPWMYSKTEKAFTPNEDFIKLHGENAHNFFTPDDVKKTHPKLAAKISKTHERFGKDDGQGIGEYIPEAQKVISQA